MTKAAAFLIDISNFDGTVLYLLELLTIMMMKRMGYVTYTSKQRRLTTKNVLSVDNQSPTPQLFWF
jgi:uncharacterized protein YlbG (UPF0298 family)